MSKPERFNLSKLPREPKTPRPVSDLLARINGYVCQRPTGKKPHITLTVDVDEGVTPFMIGCPDCGFDAYSMMYPRTGRIPPMSAVTHEWYSPSNEELKTLHPANFEHVRRGGLLMRKRTDRQPVLHKS
jgi:hypothetical protein